MIIMGIGHKTFVVAMCYDLGDYASLVHISFNEESLEYIHLHIQIFKETCLGLWCFLKKQL